jgi:hypothetical protein
MPVRSALANAAHLTAGTAFVALMYSRIGGAWGADALSVGNVGAIAVTLWSCR